MIASVPFARHLLKTVTFFAAPVLGLFFSASASRAIEIGIVGLGEYALALGRSSHDDGRDEAEGAGKLVLGARFGSVHLMFSQILVGLWSGLLNLSGFLIANC